MNVECYIDVQESRRQPNLYKKNGCLACFPLHTTRSLSEKHTHTKSTRVCRLLGKRTHLAVHSDFGRVLQEQIMALFVSRAH